MINSRYGAEIDKERPLRDHIPYSSHINDTTLMTTDKALIRVFELQGMPFDTKGNDDIARLKNELNEWLRALSNSDCALWSHVVRCQTQTAIDGRFDGEYARDFDERYNQAFQHDVRVNKLYVTLVLRPPKGLHRHIGQAIMDSVQQSLRTLDALSSQLCASLISYDVTPLGCYSHQEQVYSHTLSFLNYLLTGVWKKVRVSTTPIRDIIGHAWVFMDSETIELRRVDSSTYCQAIEIKDYTDSTFSGMLNGLLYADYDFILTQSFSLLSQKRAASHFNTSTLRMSKAGSDAQTQLIAMQTAKDELADGIFAAGEYHFSLMLMAKSVADVREARSHANKLMENQGFLMTSAAIATDAMFFAQLPANWRYRPRVVVLTSRNFAGLSPFANFMTGKARGNPWGPAVTRLSSLSGYPFYFNYHFTPLKVNALNEKTLANTIVIGKSGQGKSVLLSLLLFQSQKFADYDGKFSTVFFDKDRGAEAAIRALDGAYLRIIKGQPSHLNPLQMEPTPANILFLKEWVMLLADDDPEHPLTKRDKEKISDAINRVMAMDKPLRRLSTVVQNFTTGTSAAEQENSLKQRLTPWLAGNDYGWVFDNAEDWVDFDQARNIGIDGTDFLDDNRTRTPISLYLLHRLNDVLDGRRLIYMMDEAWKWLNDPIFGNFVEDKQVTIRKLNGLGIFSTQDPEQALKSGVGRMLFASAQTLILLPNPGAEKKDYIKYLKLTDAEFDMLMSLKEGSRLCLVKQGENAAICSLAMPDNMLDDLIIMSVGKDESPLLDDALAQSSQPSEWIPDFIQRVRARNRQRHEQEARYDKDHQGMY